MACIFGEIVILVNPAGLWYKLTDQLDLSVEITARNNVDYHVSVMLTPSYNVTVFNFDLNPLPYDVRNMLIPK
jgi:hypothetical protein